MDEVTVLRADQIAALTRPGITDNRLIALVESLLMVAYLSGRVDCAEDQLKDLTDKRRTDAHT